MNCVMGSHIWKLPLWTLPTASTRNVQMPGVGWATRSRIISSPEDGSTSVPAMVIFVLS